jgi:hypothetical protein
MREGKSKDGSDLNPAQMPFGVFGAMNDTELTALWEFLKQVPARPMGER